MAQKFTDTNSTNATDRIGDANASVFGGYYSTTAVHLADGSCAYLVCDGTNWLLKHSGADHATVALIGTLSATDFSTSIAAVLIVDSLDNLFVLGGNSAAGLPKCQAFTKGVGYSWVAQTTLAAASGVLDNFADAKWCNTGGGTNSKGHIIVATGHIAIAAAAAYFILDAGAALAGSGTLVTATGSNPAFIKTTNAAYIGMSISNDGFGATSGLCAMYDVTGTAMRVGKWSVSAAGALVTNANVGTATLATTVGKLRCIRYAADSWVVLSAAASGTGQQYSCSRWTSSARVTDTTNTASPTNMPLTDTQRHDFYLDPTTANRVWCIATGTLATGSLPVWRVSCDVGAGVSWAGAATADDTLTTINTDQKSLRCVQEPRNTAIDWQVFEKISGTNWALLGDFTGTVPVGRTHQMLV